MGLENLCLIHQMDEGEYWEPEGYTKESLYPVPQDPEDEDDDEELPSKVHYAKFQEEKDFDPEP
jgi:hypothetical protein